MYHVLIDPELQNHKLKFDPDFLSNFSINQINGMFNDLIDENTPSNDFSESCISPDSSDVPDFSDACLKFLSDILDEDLDETPATIQEFRALQATEKSLYDVLGEEYSPSDDLRPLVGNPDVKSDGILGRVLNEASVEPFLRLNDRYQSVLELNTVSSRLNNGYDCVDGLGVASSPASILSPVLSEKSGQVARVSRSRRKKNHGRDDGGGNEGGRSSKQQASSNEDYVEMKEYDDIILCREDKLDLATCGVESSGNEAKNGSLKGKTMRGKKKNNAVEEVDLRTLLTNCAQAVASFDLKSANERLRQIRQHSSPYGDSLQRLAHYFANALEARLAGTGSTVSGNIVDARISSSDFLKAYRVYVSAIPCKRLSYFLANSSILKLAENATRIHIIDFGVLLGLQWPCLIQNLSKRPGGPPELRITGIDYPQQGFRPAERVEATGRRLAGYCERFNVPFKYQAIAQKWDTIMADDLKVENDELVIVNCMYRSGTLLDETVEVDSQKDAFLRLIKRINPSLFIHGVCNGTYNAPFFITRFREALFHYSSIFDVFQETNTRGDHERLIIESELYGREVMNIVACEGTERILRPETYKQWQTRTARVGLMQLPLDRELLGRARSMMKANYQKDFVVDEDRHWMLQSWKGRTLFALSIWQPC